MPRAVLGALLTVVALQVGANGWEHTAVPLSALIRAFDSDNPELRQRASESLGYRHERAAADALLDFTIQDEPVARVRQSVYTSLGLLGDRRAFDAVAGCVQNETQRGVRGACVDALGGLQSAAAEQLLIKLLDSKETTERLRAATALGSYPSAAAVTALGGQVRDGSAQPDLVIRAVSALGRTGNNAASTYLLPLLTLETDRPLLLTALRAISLVGDNSAAAALDHVYKQAGDDDIRRAALLGLSAVAADNAADYAVRALDRDDRLVRLQALEILLQQAVGHNDGPPLQSGNVVRAVVDRCLDWAAPLFDDALSGPKDAPTLAGRVADLELLHACLRTVIALDARFGFPLFRLAATRVELRRDRPAMVDLAQGYYRARWQALYGIGYTFNPDAEPILRDALADQDFRIRAVALRSVGVYGARGFADAVIVALDDPAAEVRWTAARVLGRKPGFASGDALLRLLADSHSVVRREAALSAGYAGVTEARDKLALMQESDPDDSVRDAAEFALSLLTTG